MRDLDCVFYIILLFAVKLQQCIRYLQLHGRSYRLYTKLQKESSNGGTL